MRKFNYHPRIYPANYPILKKFSPDHLAFRALQIHAEACDICVAKEIEWPDQGNVAIEQEWFSEERNQLYQFSTFAYEFISYDLVLDGWLEMASTPAKSEIRFLSKELPVINNLLQECSEASAKEKNELILPLMKKAEEYIEAYYKAIMQRFLECGISWNE